MAKSRADQYHLSTMETVHDAQYDEEIFEYLTEKENHLMPGPRLPSNSDIAGSARAEVLGWALEIHKDYIRGRNSIFLVANYFDRFLSLYKVSPGQLGLLVGVMLVIATKYDNGPTDTLSLRDIEAYLDFSYDLDTLEHAERTVLLRLGYELGWPTPLEFLRRVCRVTAENSDDSALAENLLGMTIMDERFIQIPPSHLASASIYLVRKVRSLSRVSAPGFIAYTYAEI